MRFPRSILISAILSVAAAASGWAQPVGVEDDIRGPKPLVEIPVEKASHLALWVAVAAIVAALAFAAYLWKRKTKKSSQKSPPEIAIAALGELEATREALPAEEFANRAADTVRQYIAARFGLAAPRRTTEEFLQDLTHDETSPLAHHSDTLRGFLKSCDMAKFAGTQLEATQRVALVDSARGFVRATSTDQPS